MAATKRQKRQRTIEEGPVRDICFPETQPKGDAFYRDLYKGRVDFGELGKKDAALDALLDHGHLDFQDPEAVRQLTLALLHVDFGLELALPDDRLCPPVPSRHNYILWLKGLVDSTTGPLGGSDSGAGPAPGQAVVGLDIGTGASCVYPLLGCTQRANWHFVATDIDQESLRWARDNVARNPHLQDRIRVVARSPDDRLIPLREDADEQPAAAAGDDGLPAAYDFVMVNPPFYASAAELEASAAAKNRPPHAICTGAPVEMVYPGGGELAFVGRLLAESVTLRTRVGWYTAMLGKLSTVMALVEQLRARAVDNYAVSELAQGGKTRRWAVGWSYGARRPAMEVARGGLALYKHVLPAVTEAEVASMRPGDRGADAEGAAPALATTALVKTLAETVDRLLQQLDLLSWAWDRQALRGAGTARQNVWGRAYRRQKQRQQKEKEHAMADGGTEAAEGSSEEGVFGFVVSIHVNLEATTVQCRWAEGHKEVLFESFCGFLRAKLAQIGG